MGTKAIRWVKTQSVLWGTLCGLWACQSTSGPSGDARIVPSPPKQLPEVPKPTSVSKPHAPVPETPTLHEVPKGPAQASEIASFYSARCPVAPFSLPSPEIHTLAGQQFSIHGSRWERLEKNGAKDLRLGILGALKDASSGTRKNIKQAARRFAKEKIDFLVVNGDLGEDQELDAVFSVLGENFSVPILVFAGNIEWTSAFTDAFAKAQARYPHFINGNWTRHLDLGGVHLLTLPGWSNRRFMQSGACRYGESDIEDLRHMAQPLVDAGEPVVLLTHGPPRGDGSQALDMTHDAGNVGDESLRRLIDEMSIPFGIFSHILESGGRIRTGLTDGELLNSPVRQARERLYLNVGSASAFAWEMLDKKRSEGMAAIFRLHNGKATARIFPLKRAR